MNTMKTSTGNTTALFIKDGILSQHPGWYLQKIRKNIIFPRIAHLPTKYATFSPLPSGYLEVKNISMIPRIEKQVFTHEGDRSPLSIRCWNSTSKQKKMIFNTFCSSPRKKRFLRVISKSSWKTVLRILIPTLDTPTLPTPVSPALCTSPLPLIVSGKSAYLLSKRSFGGNPHSLWVAAFY